MRLFIAIPLPEAVHDELRRVQERLRQAQADVKWVQPEQIHVTLKFLGEVDAGMVPPIQHALDRVARQAWPFVMQCAGLGGFPHLKAPRVIWVGLEPGRDEVTQVARRLEEAVSALGFPKEDRMFSAHLTLGRVRSPANRSRLARLIETEPFASVTPVTVDQVTLFQSTLAPSGSLYAVVHMSPFGRSA